MADALIAAGWPAEWLNGWMASLGVLARTEMRLSFTAEPSPKPCFTRPDGGPVVASAIASALMSVEELQRLVIARPAAEGRPEFPRDPTAEQYRSRASAARRAEDPFLGATVTDLVADPTRLHHSPFDAAVPQGLTVWQRVVSCVERLDDPAAQTAASLEGRLARVKLNGLGFDARRVAVSTSTDKEKYVDPVVEVLAFASLPMFPVRGRGAKTPTTRGWNGPQTRRGAFTWPVWGTPLTWPAVDALLNEFWNARPDARDPRSTQRWRAAAAALGVFGCYGSVAYKPTASSDNTRAYSSEELWMTI